MTFLKYIKLLPILTVTTFFLLSSDVHALSASQFDPGRIIDDSVFFDKNSMNANDIQYFLNQKTPSCDTTGGGSKSYYYNVNTQKVNDTEPGHDPGAWVTTTRATYGNRYNVSENVSYATAPYVCLKDYSQNTPGMAAGSYCKGAYAGGTKSAAQIIYDVSQACGISSKVLLVLLQKEQSLVTDDWPWRDQYLKATGFSCSDSAPCDPSFSGFFYQVYYAAKQYQRYAKDPVAFNYTAGSTEYIQYNPDATCGGSNVTIQNQATAGLYNYTPYQPNAGSIAHKLSGGRYYSTGYPDCGSYGNVNFWLLYTTWFGSTTNNTRFAWSYESQAAFSDDQHNNSFTSTPTVAPNQKLYVQIRARNMGTQTWTKDNISLGTSNPTDRNSVFYDTSWLSYSRVARISESTVYPGQVGTFDFIMNAPSSTGSYSEYFNPVVDGEAWLNNIGQHFLINVVQPVSPSAVAKNSLSSGDSLNKNQYIISQDGQSTLNMQSDGNLVLYQNYKAVWSSQTSGTDAIKLIMQSDGNLVLYDSKNSPLWNSGTPGSSSSSAYLQSDGNFVVYSSLGTPRWSTSTFHNPNLLGYVNSVVGQAKIYAGQQLQTANRKYSLIMQADGNLVLYSPNRAIWNSGTPGRPGSYLYMQQDGNLVIYDTSNRAIWNSGTPGRI